MGQRCLEVSSVCRHSSVGVGLEQRGAVQGHLQASYGSPFTKSGWVSLLWPFSPSVRCWRPSEMNLLQLVSRCMALRQHPWCTVTQGRWKLEIFNAFFASPSMAWSDSSSGHLAVVFENAGDGEIAAVPTCCNAGCCCMEDHILLYGLYVEETRAAHLLIYHENLFPRSYNPMK